MSEYVSEATSAAWDKEVVGHNGIVMIDFWAVWCGPCRMIAPAVEELAKEYTEKIKDAEQLGGTQVHMERTGISHLTAKSEEEAIQLTRTVLGYFPSNNVENPPYKAPDDNPQRMDRELNTNVPIDPLDPYNMHEVIMRIVDLDSFVELHPLWACNAIVGLARMGGHCVGVVAQEPSIMAGVIDIDASDKMTRFVRMCDCFNLPLVTFVDSPGFLPGVAQEHGGIIRASGNPPQFRHMMMSAFRPMGQRYPL